MTPEKRGHHGQRAVGRGADIGHRRTGPERQVFQAGQVRKPSGHLRQLVEIGPVAKRSGKKSLHRAIDDAWIDSASPLVAESQPIERAGGKVIEDHVGVLDQALEDRLALGLTKVEREVLLVAVIGKEGRAVVAAAATGVAAVRMLDLDYVGAQVGEDHPAARAGDDMAQLEDTNPFQRQTLLLNGRLAHLLAPHCAIFSTPE
jgi:hypothetical protein